MTTFTDEDKELIKEIKERIGSLDVRDNIERRAYEIALASLEAEAPNLPGGFTIEEAKELHENLVKSHVSKALSGEKMKKENRDADLRWIHGVIVQAAWFVKASLGQNAYCVPAFLLATVDLPLPRRSLAMLGRWTAASG